MSETLTSRPRVVPANEASWADVQAVFGERGAAHTCQCQWFKLPHKEWQQTPTQELEFREREITHCGEPAAAHTTGLLAFLDGDPAAWVAVEPRVNYARLQTMRVPWLGRAAEDRHDPGVWAITCFVTRVGYRRRGLMRTLTAAAVDFARGRGATAIEGYPMITKPGEKLSWGELFVGSASAFADAGFHEVSRPSERRAVMRIDF